MAAMEYDCQTCGACCLVGLDVLLTRDEAERFEGRAELVQLTVPYEGGFYPPLRFMRKLEDGRCCALEGGLGKCRCTIYADRPNLCHEFQAGSPDCLSARRKMGLET